jgi:hypothetical protein
MHRSILIASLFIGLSLSVLAEQLATTDKGMRVKLFVDGTWEAVEKAGNIQNPFLYQDDNVEIFLLNTLYTEYESFVGKNFSIYIQVNVVSKGKMVQILNLKSFEYENELGGVSLGNYPIGFSIEDDYDNVFKLSTISPGYTNYSNKVAPNEKLVFNLALSQPPLDISKSLQITVASKALGNTEEFSFALPIKSECINTHNLACYPDGSYSLNYSDPLSAVGIKPEPSIKEIRSKGSSLAQTFCQSQAKQKSQINDFQYEGIHKGATVTYTCI